MGFLDSLFGKKKKSQEDIGGKPMLAWEAPSYAPYSSTLTSRIAGKGVGYRPEILSGTTSAYAKQRRGDLEGYEIPAITSGASARGLGRSSVVTSQIGRAEQEAGRDIEERVSQMALADEQQRRQEINQALQSQGALLGAEIGSSQVRGNWEKDVSQWHALRSDKRKAEEDAFRNKLIATGGAVLSPILSAIPGVGPMLGSMASGATAAASGNYGSMGDIDSMLSSLGASTVNMSRAPVTIGGQGYNPPTLSQLYRMKGRG